MFEKAIYVGIIKYSYCFIAVVLCLTRDNYKKLRGLFILKINVKSIYKAHTIDVLI